MMMDGSYMKGFFASVVPQVGARKGYYLMREVEIQFIERDEKEEP